MEKVVSGIVLMLLLISMLTFAFRAYPVKTELPAHTSTISSSLEQQVVALVNGSRTYNYDLELENIAYGNYAFRAGGSVGANESANWIKEQFESFGLEAWLEPFEFTTWDLLSKPSLLTDDDGNVSTTSDQIMIPSFQCEHYSWPTPESGVFSDLVILPLPDAGNRDELSTKTINMTEWDAIDTTGKIVLIGREVSWCQGGMPTFLNKISEQPPAAIVRTWWFDWMSFVPDFFSSTGGRPLSSLGPYFWNLQIPVGSVSYEDGLLLRNKENAINISACVSVKSIISTGTHYNVVGRIRGYESPEKIVIVSSHYDTVMCSGFCDNGAGTAGVIELAKVFGDVVKTGIYKPRYTILFVTFASEELGLVGSINYVKQHKNEMANIIAVINLDGIGSDELYVTETDPANGFDLDQTILNAARDLNIAAALEAPGGSDQESFRNPSWANNIYYWYWGLEADIADATPVNSSALIISFPLLYSDMWTMGAPGWIHTSYDNSTSTMTFNWVEIEDLENHVKVAALSITRISPMMIVIDKAQYTWYGDLIVNETDKVVIENCNFIVENGMIYVYGTLNITNSTVWMRNVSLRYKNVKVYGNFTMSNSKILGNNKIICETDSNVLVLNSFSPKTMLAVSSDGQAYVYNSSLQAISIYHGNAQLLSSNFSEIVFSFRMNSKLYTSDSYTNHLLLLELDYNGNLEIRSGFVESLTIYSSHYSANFTLSRSFVGEWYVNCAWFEGKFFNSVIGTLDFGIDPAWSGSLTLPSGHIEYLKLDWSYPPFIIENSTVNEWRISIFGDNSVQLFNSENLDLDIGESAKVSMLNSYVLYLCVYEDFSGSISATNATINSANIRLENCSLDFALKEGFHEYFNLYIPEHECNITLINSTVNHWWIDAWSNATISLSNSTLTADLGWCPYNLQILRNSICYVRDSNLETIFCSGSTYELYPALTIVNCTVNTLYAYNGANITLINSIVNMLITDPIYVTLINSNILLMLDFSLEMTHEDSIIASITEECIHPLPNNIQRFSPYINITTTYNDCFETQVKIYYNETEVNNAGKSENELQMYYLDESNAWRPCRIQGVNTIENYVWANVTHLSYFTLGINTLEPALTMEGPYYHWFGIEYWIVTFDNNRPIRLISNYF